MPLLQLWSQVLVRACFEQSAGKIPCEDLTDFQAKVESNRNPRFGFRLRFPRLLSARAASASSASRLAPLLRPCSAHYRFVSATAEPNIVTTLSQWSCVNEWMRVNECERCYCARLHCVDSPRCCRAKHRLIVIVKCHVSKRLCLNVWKKIDCLEILL